MKRFASVPRQREAWRARWLALPMRTRRIAGIVAAILLCAVLAVVLFRNSIGGWLWPDSQAADLRARAGQALQAGRLSATDGSGARELYEAALAVQPDQVEAQEGLARVALAALAQAQTDARNGRDAQARIALQLARELDAPKSRVDAVEALLRKDEAALAGIDALLARADAARSAGHLDDGDAAALPLYRQVLALEPRNQRAVEGREDALTDLLQPAQRALGDGDLRTLAALVARAEAFDPGHVDLPDLRAGQARLLEQAQRHLQAYIAARRFERAAELCTQLRDAQGNEALPATCAREVVGGLAARASTLAEDFDFAASEQLIATARTLAADDPRVQDAARQLAQARQGARKLPQSPRNMRRATTDARRLLVEAERAQSRGDWLTPPGDSAWDKLRAARALAPDDREVLTAWRAMEPAARRCFDAALRDNRLREARTCFDAWRQFDPGDRELPQARRRLAQRWIAIGIERLEAGETGNARNALEQARALDPQAPGLREFAERVAKAQ